MLYIGAKRTHNRVFGFRKERNDMKEAFKMVSLQQDRTKACSFDFLNRETVESIRDFHKSFPMYQPTPLACLKDTAAELGLGAMYVKDESYRFGLNAFKVLGGSYAIGHYLANRLGKPMKEVDFPTLVSDETRKELGDVTFVTATDGNHGRGVAWTARQFQQKAVVYMPKGSAAERLANIQAEGADASITDLNYDDAVRLANSQGEKYGWFRIRPGRATRTFPPGSCRATAPWAWRLTSSCRRNPPTSFCRRG